MVDSREKVCHLYKIKHKILPIIYIGLSSDIKARFRDHKRESSNRNLRGYIQKLGSDSFDFNIICSGSRNYIEYIEEKLILISKEDKDLIVCNVLDGSATTGASSQQGEAHWNSKFTEEDIRRIRSIYASGGVTQKEIGELYGVSNKVISSITSGARWSSVSNTTITKNSRKNKVANRRKLTDTQVTEIRYKAKEEFDTTGLLDIPRLAKLYYVSRGSMRILLKGGTYSELPGPILKVDYFTKFGRS